MMFPTNNMVVVQRQDNTTYPRYSRGTSTCLGISHLVIIFVMFLSSIFILLLGNSNLGAMEATMGCLILYIAAGVCAIVAGVKANKFVVIASMVLNILASIVAVSIAFVMAVLVLLLQGMSTGSESFTILLLFYLVLVVYIAQAGITIWSSAIGCSVVCCGSSNVVNSPVVMASTAPAMVPMHMPVQQVGFQQQQSAYPQQLGVHPQQQPAYPQQLGVHPQQQAAYSQQPPEQPEQPSAKSQLSGVLPEEEEFQE